MHYIYLVVTGVSPQSPANYQLSAHLRGGTRKSYSSQCVECGQLFWDSIIMDFTLYQALCQALCHGICTIVLYSIIILILGRQHIWYSQGPGLKCPNLQINIYIKLISTYYIVCYDIYFKEFSWRFSWCHMLKHHSNVW